MTSATAGMNDSVGVLRDGLTRLLDPIAAILICWMGWQVMFGGTQAFEWRAFLVGLVAAAAALIDRRAARTLPVPMIAYVAFVAALAWYFGSQGGRAGWQALQPVSHHLVMLVFVFGCAYTLRTSARLASFAVAYTVAIAVIAAQVTFDRTVTNFEFLRTGPASLPHIAQWGGLHQIGFVLLIGFAFPLALLFQSRHWAGRAAGAVLVVALTIAAYLNDSMSAMATMALMVAVAAALMVVVRIPALITVGVVAAGGVLLTAFPNVWWPVVERLAAAGDFMNRVRIWRAAYRIFADHVWLGVGPGNYSVAMFDGGYYKKLIFPLTAGAEQAHNFVLHAAAETGIAGALLLTLMWIWLMRGALIAWLRGPEQVLRLGLLLALIGSFLRLLTDNFLDGLDTTRRTRVLVWMFLAGAVAVARLSKGRAPELQHQTGS
jgi:O-antigen ligase